MAHAISLGLGLAGVWLLLSGHYVPLILVFGAASCLLVVYIAHRMDVVDHEGQPIHLGWRILLYWTWLGWQIVLSNIDVAKRILNPRLPISPTLVRVKTSQRSELGQVIYANSITLTPGTVSIQVSEGAILVHAVAREMAADLEGGEMDRRVSAVESREGRSLAGTDAR